MNGIVGFTLISLICWFSVCATGTCYVVKIIMHRTTRNIEYYRER